MPTGIPQPARDSIPNLQRFAVPGNRRLELRTCRQPGRVAALPRTMKFRKTSSSRRIGGHLPFPRLRCIWANRHRVNRQPEPATPPRRRQGEGEGTTEWSAHPTRDARRSTGRYRRGAAMPWRREGPNGRSPARFRDTALARSRPRPRRGSPHAPARRQACFAICPANFPASWSLISLASEGSSSVARTWAGVSVSLAGRKAGAIVFTQGSDMRIAVLTVNFAVLVAMAVVEARLFHCVPPPDPAQPR